MLISSINPAAYAGIFLVGGPGALENLDTEDVRSMVKKFADAGKAYGAICISPRILAGAGLLKGKKATGWDEDGELADIFKAGEVTYLKQPVVVDGNVITAVGPRVATEFAQAIVKLVQ